MNIKSLPSKNDSIELNPEDIQSLIEDSKKILGDKNLPSKKKIMEWNLDPKKSLKNHIQDHIKYWEESRKRRGIK